MQTRTARILNALESAQSFMGTHIGALDELSVAVPRKALAKLACVLRESEAAHALGALLRPALVDWPETAVDRKERRRS